MRNRLFTNEHLVQCVFAFPPLSHDNSILASVMCDEHREPVQEENGERGCWREGT